MNERMSNYLCEYECDEEIRYAVKYRLNIDPYETAKEAIASMKGNILNLISSVVGRTLDVWRNNYNENVGDYCANVIYTALKPELYFSDEYLSGIAESKNYTILLDQYFRKVLPFEGNYYEKMKNYIKERLENTNQSAAVCINRAYRILCHLLDGYNDESIEDKNAFENYLENFNKGQSFVACAIGDTDGFGRDRRLDGNSIVFAQEKECELYTDMVARNILQIYMCRIYNDPIRFTKCDIQGLYDQKSVKNGLYAGYRKSCIRELLHGKDTDGERFTSAALCFTEYSAMCTTLFTRYNKKMIIDEFYRIVGEEIFVDDNLDVFISDELKMHYSSEHCDKLCRVVKELYSLDYEATKAEIAKVENHYYKDILDIVLKNYHGWNKNFCKTYFNSLCERLNEARNQIIGSFGKKMKTERKYQLLLIESEYMIERLYGINSIRSEVNKSSERIDSDKILEIMRVQNIHLRNIFLNMRIEKDRLLEYIQYETEFLYPLIMYMVQYAIEVYMGDEKASRIKLEKILYSLYGYLKEKYVMEYDSRKFNKAYVKGNENALDRVYKGLWKRYEASDFSNAFAESIRNTTDFFAAKETVKIWLRR